LTEKSIPRVMFRRGKKIFSQGDAGDRAYLIDRGQVAIIMESSHGPVMVETIGSRTIFGEMALIDGTTRMATAVAAEDTTCIVIKPAQLRKKLTGLPEHLHFAFNAMMEYVRRTLPFEARKQFGAAAETKQDARIRKLLPTAEELAKLRWADPVLKVVLEMMCDYTRRRLPPADVPTSSAGIKGPSGRASDRSES
jgi:CRP/FNR family cyclic AMP-dependent transcriptional regulator